MKTNSLNKVKIVGSKRLSQEIDVMFPIGARQGALKVTPHGAKRSVGQAMINKNESRRDDSAVQNVVSTKEASLRDAGV